MTIDKSPAIITPGPGIYRGVPFAEYAAWDAVNKSRLDWIQDYSPRHCRYHMDEREEDTDSLLIGRAYHTLTLEGEEKYLAEFPISTACAATVKSSGKPCENSGVLVSPDGKWYCRTKGHAPEGSASCAGALTADQNELVRQLRRGTLDCEEARKFIYSKGENELSIIWIDAVTDLTCKARIDMARPSWNSIGDLKTTTCASRDKFEKAIAEWGYHRQSAFYLRGCKEVGLELDHFSIFPVEKDAPNVSSAYLLSEDAIAAGAEQNDQLLATYAACVAANEWPGYAGGFEEISIPPWEMNKIVKSQKLRNEGAKFFRGELV